MMNLLKNQFDSFHKKKKQKKRETLEVLALALHLFIPDNSHAKLLLLFQLHLLPTT